MAILFSSKDGQIQTRIYDEQSGKFELDKNPSVDIVDKLLETISTVSADILNHPQYPDSRIIFRGVKILKNLVKDIENNTPR